MGWRVKNRTDWKIPFALLSFGLLSSTSLHAEVTLPSIFGDHMVLQQARIFPIWGKSSPRETVSVFIAGQSAQTTASADGSWKVMMRAIAPTDKSFTLVVQGKNRLEIHDVVVGDVWICAGGENMEFPLSDAVGGKDPQGEPGDQSLRFYVSEKIATDKPNQLGAGHWVLCTPENSPGFSAAGYFFARDLRSATHQTIGMIQCTWSGSNDEAWISHAGLSESPSFPRYSSKNMTNSLDQKTPSALFNGIISPLIRYAVTGVIWYSPESQEGCASLEYRRLFPRLIRDWRKQSEQRPLPFYFVQSAGFGDDEQVVEPFSGRDQISLPWLREGTACALTLSHTGMAVATDLGLPDEQQPPDKLDVGRRLALIARKEIYGEKIEAAGPSFHSMQIEGSTIRVTFDHVGSGLTLGISPFERDNVPVKVGTQLAGFAVAGSDGKWFQAAGHIENNTVLLSSDAVSHPMAVRYNWKGFPTGNLYNKEGLPVPPFRTDAEQPEGLK
jgi:sialate O-acetylesterase